MGELTRSNRFCVASIVSWRFGLRSWRQELPLQWVSVRSVRDGKTWNISTDLHPTRRTDIYPILHRLPQKVFLHWRDRATHVQRSMNALYASFLTGIRSRRSTSGSRGSLMDKVLDQVESEKAAPGMTYSDHELWFLGGTMTEGGSDTSASIITAFVQAMVAYPDVQRKAQTEIDGVVGEDRSPTWEDYAALPYVGECLNGGCLREIKDARLTSLLCFR
jgi:cytochrome P450